MHSLLENYFGLIRRFIPLQTEGSSVGLDIGNGDCKLIQIEKTADSFELLNWAIEPVDRGDVRSAISKMLGHLELPYKSVYTSVSGKGTLIRYIEMPRMSAEEMRKSFTIEADKYFPFSQDQIYTDCFILDPQGKGKSMSVMAAAVKREMIDERIKLLTDLGIQTDFIGINPVALVNGLHVLGKQAQKDNAGATALFDMGESVSNLTILVDGWPRFTRDIFIGGKDYSKRISNALGIGFQEAEELKREPGERTEEIMNACESAIMNTVQELRLSFDYFMTEKNREISQLVLTGGASMLEGVFGIFEKSLDLRVGVWDPVSLLKIPPQLSAQDIGKKSLKLGVAVGLALYQYD